MSFTSAQDYNNDDSYEHIKDIVGDLRTFIDRIQHASIKDLVWLEKMQHTGEELAAKVFSLANSAGERHLATFRTVKTLAERILSFTAELASHPTPQSLSNHREALARGFEEFLVELKKREIEGAAMLAQTNHLKPVNYNRNIVHVFMAVFGVICYLFFLTRFQALAVLGSISALFGFLEVSRRFFPKWNEFLCEKVFRSIIRPSEHYKVNSATYFVFGLFIIVLLFPKTPVLVATLILGLSDPVATLIGKRWGHKKFYGDKSIVGSLAFLVTGFVVAALFILYAEPTFAVSHVLFVAGVMAFSGMLAEIFSGLIDDNLAVPIVCALVGTLVI